uniref:Uncharacterized protein n=1 Tax=Anguilla anguilla TaxID=7936 RepID=A0A0E9S919_ANGAN
MPYISHSSAKTCMGQLGALGAPMRSTLDELIRPASVARLAPRAVHRWR